MSIYRCEGCNNLEDSDYEVVTVYCGKQLCPGCVELPESLKDPQKVLERGREILKERELDV